MTVPQVTPTAFRERWPEGVHEQITLLDVRETVEIRLATVPDTLQIPMTEVPARLAELSNDKTIIVMCHSGVRSQRVAEFLLASGFDDVFNLTGGIDAWSQEIDPTVERY